MDRHQPRDVKGTTDRGATIYDNSGPKRWLVIFWTQYSTGERQVSCAHPSRSYKTAGGADRAAAKWAA
jgi:hypothetical protein